MTDKDQDNTHCMYALIAFMAVAFTVAFFIR